MTDLITTARELALSHFTGNPSSFYGRRDDLGVGAGLIFNNITIPYYEINEGLFYTAKGLVYVISHECDIDDQNTRQFNEFVLVCPIIRLEDWIEEHNLGAFGLLPKICQNLVYRVQYLPPIPFGDSLVNGGLMYLNNICHTHIEEFRKPDTQRVCALSQTALPSIDYKLENHFRRPKDDYLPRLQ